MNNKVAKPISTHLYDLKSNFNNIAPTASKKEIQKLQSEIEKELKEILDFATKDNTASGV